MLIFLSYLKQGAFVRGGRLHADILPRDPRCFQLPARNFRTDRSAVHDSRLRKRLAGQPGCIGCQMRPPVFQNRLRRHPLCMIVCSYLVRLEPFTQHFLHLQGTHLLGYSEFEL